MSPLRGCTPHIWLILKYLGLSYPHHSPFRGNVASKSECEVCSFTPNFTLIGALCKLDQTLNIWGSHTNSLHHSEQFGMQQWTHDVLWHANLYPDHALCCPQKPQIWWYFQIQHSVVCHLAVERQNSTLMHNYKPSPIQWYQNWFLNSSDLIATPLTQNWPWKPSDEQKNKQQQLEHFCPSAVCNVWAPAYAPWW